MALLDSHARNGERCERLIRRVIDLNPRVNAYSQILADTARLEARESPPDAPLAGVTVAIKDNIDTIPAVCNAGLDYNGNHQPVEDAEVVARLRGAGAIVLGVTRTDSGAFGVTTPQVINPLDPGLIAGGSSGGSAAAVAADLCDVALGTDTGGSIRIPAACCGVFGLKPTRGSVSLRGIRPLAGSCDHVGPLASSIVPLATVMRVLAPGFESRTCAISRPLSIGIPRSAILEAAADVLSALDHFTQSVKESVVFKDVPFPDFDDLLAVHMTLSLGEASGIFEDLRDDDLASMPEVARLGIMAGRAVSDRDVGRAQHHRALNLQLIDRLFDRVDFLLLPTLPVLPPPRDTRRVRIGSVDRNILHALIRYTSPFNQTGHPVLAFPWPSNGTARHGSLQLVAPRGMDCLLLEVGQQLIRRPTAEPDTPPECR
ncbi:MAG: amidase [Deltaproteobacteria bacterium]|nr:amidase [Deltaproteobacteria bacterium]